MKTLKELIQKYTGEKPSSELMEKGYKWAISKKDSDKLLKEFADALVNEAVQLCWTNWSEICELGIIDKENSGRMVNDYHSTCGEDGLSWIEITIPTLEGPLVAKHGDWIIKGIQGELYPCHPDIFEKTYESIEE